MALCDSTSGCNTINFCPTGATCISGTGRCCRRSCSSCSLQECSLTTQWLGWTVLTKGAPSDTGLRKYMAIYSSYSAVVLLVLICRSRAEA